MIIQSGSSNWENKAKRSELGCDSPNSAAAWSHVVSHGLERGANGGQMIKHRFYDNQTYFRMNDEINIPKCLNSYVCKLISEFYVF